MCGWSLPSRTEVDTRGPRSEDDHTNTDSADGVTRSDDDGSHGVEYEREENGDRTAGQISNLK
jgi:hypothetical protein